MLLHQSKAKQKQNNVALNLFQTITRESHTYFTF